VRDRGVEVDRVAFAEIVLLAADRQSQPASKDVKELAAIVSGTDWK
jgi:hypothetical protein